MAYAHLVKNVIAHLTQDADGLRVIYVPIRHNADGDKVISIVSLDLVGAIETWLAKPQAPTPEERAEKLSELWGPDRATQRDNFLADVAAAIREAINDDRAARGET